MEVSATTQPPSAADADTVVVGVFEDQELDADVPAELRELLASGEAARSFKSLALAHTDGTRWLSVGLGPRADFDSERARVAAAVARERLRELSTRALCWRAPAGEDADLTAALVEGTILADYRFERFKSTPTSDEDSKPKHLERLIVSSPQDLAGAVAAAALVAEAANAARDLQNRPANDLTPTVLAAHATALAAEVEALSVEVEGREEIRGRGMGAFAAVAQGSEQEPALITLRYEPPAGQARGPLLGFVGKAVTFDSGGISLKTAAKMHEMKFDMAGGAAVIEAIAALAELDAPVRVVGVVGATENLPSGTAVKPGDIVTARDGTTIEVNNTDAEGRLVLADCISYALSEGCERLVDVATLTGGVVVALGSVYAGLMANDDDWAARVEASGRRSGELLWRLPLHPAYAEMVKGRYAQLTNLTDPSATTTPPVSVATSTSRSQPSDSA